jgi:hypothetical protein
MERLPRAANIIPPTLFARNVVGARASHVGPARGGVENSCVALPNAAYRSVG